MAIWQVDCYIVPKERAIIDYILDESIYSWEMSNRSWSNIDFLERHKSWSDSIIQYGLNDETCIQFDYKDGLVESVRCRFDLRSLSKNMLMDIINYIEANEGKIFYEDKIYAPRFDEIVELLKKSSANRFCKNPIEYLDELYESGGK